MQRPHLTIKVLSAILLGSVSLLAGSPSLDAEAADRRAAKKFDHHGKPGHHRWKKGGKYGGKGSHVSDYRRHKLRQPPKGHRWVRDGDKFFLIATATGIIAAIAAGH